MSLNSESVATTCFGAARFSLFMFVLMDLMFVVLFFIDGRADELRFLTREFASYSFDESIADLAVRTRCAARERFKHDHGLQVLSVLRMMALAVCHWRFGLVHATPTVVRLLLRR